MTDNKPTSYDFEKVGKQMPFSVPDGFFCQLEQQIISNTGANVKKTRAPRKFWKLITGTAVAAAAAVTAFIATPNMSPDTMMADNLTVEEAFENLSASDQEFLIDNYRAELLANY